MGISSLNYEQHKYRKKYLKEQDKFRFIREILARTYYRCIILPRGIFLGIHDGSNAGAGKLPKVPICTRAHSLLV